MGGTVERGEVGGEEKERAPQGCSFPGVGTGRLELPLTRGGLWEVSSGSTSEAPGKLHSGSEGTYTFSMVPGRGNAAFLPMNSGNCCIRITWDPN